MKVIVCGVYELGLKWRIVGLNKGLEQLLRSC